KCGGRWPTLSMIPKLGLPHPSRVLCGRVGFRPCWYGSQVFATTRRPLRHDLHSAFQSSGVLCEADPLPIPQVECYEDFAKVGPIFLFAPARSLTISAGCEDQRQDLMAFGFGNAHPFAKSAKGWGTRLT